MSDAKSIAKQIEAAFLDAGAQPVELPALLPAEALLDLYGEDIRARAYITQDSVLGEQILRPDFTVPVVQRHITEGRDPARYCYSGPVWRKQAARSERPSEFTQVGFELFTQDKLADADAEVFALIQSQLPSSVAVVTGDVGLLQAALDGLNTTEARRKALRRHLWRPQRFLALLERFETGGALPSRTALAKALEVKDVDALIGEAGPFIGLRKGSEIATRSQRIVADIGAEKISSEDANALRRLVALTGSMAQIREELDEIAQTLSGLKSALERLDARNEALAKRGILVKDLPFVMQFALSSMEYYDGFVFAFELGGRVVASGGRYDALSKQLGTGQSIPAVGGVIRPEELIGASS